MDNKTKQTIPTLHRVMMTYSLSNCLDLINFISINPIKKETHIFVEHLILSLRELSFYAKKYFSEQLVKEDLNSIKSIKDIRDAICHRSSRLNLLNPNIIFIGNYNFRNNDIEIQYGKTKIYLL